MSRVGTVLVININGEIDLRTAPGVQAAVRAGLKDTGTGLCVVDLTGVRFLGSHGLAALAEASEYARARYRAGAAVDRRRRQPTRDPTYPDHWSRPCPCALPHRRRSLDRQAWRPRLTGHAGVGGRRPADLSHQAELLGTSAPTPPAALFSESGSPGW